MKKEHRLVKIINLITESQLLAQIELLDEIYQACFQEDSRTLELVEDKLLELRTQWRKINS